MLLLSGIFAVGQIKPIKRHDLAKQKTTKMLKKQKHSYSFNSSGRLKKTTKTTTQLLSSTSNRMTTWDCVSQPVHSNRN